MSFERRISSLPLYTRNLHIFLTSGHRFASDRGSPRVKQNMTVKKEKRRCSRYTEHTKLGLPAIERLQIVGYGLRSFTLKI